MQIHNINANHTGLVSAVLSVVAFILVCSYVRKQPMKLRIAFLCLFTALAIPSVLVAVYYFHRLPEMDWFYTMRSWRGSEFLVIFLGCAGGCVAALLPRVLSAFPLFFIILIAVFPYLKPIIYPLNSEDIKENWKGDVCFQATGSTCGPASICTILKSLGSNPSEREAAIASFTNGSGTEAWYLARYARSKGFVARFDFRDTFSPDVGSPAMVGVRMGGMGHFIAVLSIDGDEVTFADPMGGLERLPISKFRKRYSFTGFHMIIKNGSSALGWL